MRATANETGGGGGSGRGTGKAGGAGGSATGTVASATAGAGDSAYATVIQTGGAGGRGYCGAAGGAGASSTLTNAATASSGGRVALAQTATGGAGGYSSAGAVGTAGNGSSGLTVTDTAATSLNGTSTANGGAGGGAAAGTAGTGGTGAAGIALTGARAVTATSNATGGNGGNGGSTANGGAGGAATSTAQAVSTTTGSDRVGAYANLTGGSGGGASASGGAGASVSGASATATAASATGGLAYARTIESGGGGGRAVGAGKAAGAGGTATGAVASASGFSARAVVTQTGGSGGRGYTGAAGGAGASSTLSNAVTGTAKAGGYLTLRQTANGGAGNYSYKGAGGAAGSASSSLTATDTVAATFTGYSTASGGAGGSGNGAGASAAAGGAGTATLALTGAHVVSANATASGGNAGNLNGTAGAAGGDASASAAAGSTGSAISERATSTASATGGTGATTGAANATSAATTAAGQLAQADASARGGAGSAQAGATTGGGGIARSVSTQATAQAGSTNAALARAEAADGTQFQLISTGNTGVNAWAYANTPPNASFLATALSTHTNVNSALGGTGPKVFGAGVQGAIYLAGASGVQDYVTTITYNVDATQVSGHLEAGLLDSQVFGTGFQTLDFTVSVGGATVVSQHFTTTAAAQAYFSNQALDLGTFTPVSSLAVTFTLDLHAASSGAGFAEDFVLGATSGNAPPITTVPGAQSETSGVQAPLNGISVADADAGSASETITVALTDAAGLLTASTAGGAAVSGAGTTGLTLSGTLAQVNAALGTLAIQEPVAGSDTVTVVTNDGRGGSNTHTIAVNTVAANAPPVLTVPGAQTETAGVSAAVPGVSVSDADAGSAGETITVTLTDSAGLLSATGAGVTGSGTRTLTVTGAIAAVNSALGTLGILENAAGGDTITVAANDGRGGTASRSIGVTTAAVVTNAPPVTTVPGAQTETAGVTAALAGISVADSDAGTAGETITVLLTDATGRLSASNAGGATVSGVSTASLSLVGTLAQVNAALGTLTILEPAAGTDTVTVATSDGRGGSDSHQISVTSAANAPPVVTVPGIQTETAGVTKPVTGVSLSDADAASAGEILTVTVSDGGGLLSASGAGGASVGGAGTTSLTLTGTLGQVNAALGSLSILEASAGGDTVVVNANDGRPGGTGTGSFTVSTAPANVPPLLSVPGTQAETAGTSAAITGVSVADPDAASAGETITVTLADAAGLLSASGAGGATVGGSGTTSLQVSGTLAQVNAALGTLAILEGAAGSDTVNLAVSDGRGGADARTIGITTAPANLPPVTAVPGAQAEATGVQAALAGISVSDGDAASAGETITVSLSDATGLLSASNAGGAAVGGSGTASLTLSGSLGQVNAALGTLKIQENAPGSDTVTVATSDGRGGSDTHTISISTATPNAPPVLSVPGTQSETAGVSAPITGVAVSDADAASAGETITVTLSDAAGLLSATGAGVTGSGTRSLTVTGAIAAVNTALGTLSILEGAAGGDSITVTANDGRGGTDSRGIAVATAAATVNAPPVLTVPGAQAETAGITAALAGISVSDADAASAGETITATLTDTTGKLSATGAGVTGAGSSTLQVSGTLAQVNAALATLTILEAAAGSDTVTVATNDGRGGTDSRTVAVTTAAANVPPVLTVPGAQTETAGTTAALPGISVADGDAASASEVITATLSDGSGKLSASGAGVTASGAGTTSLTLTGGLAAVNAALGALTILEAAAGSDTVSVAVNDGRGGTDSRTIAVSTVAANLPPVLTVPGAQTETAGVGAALSGVSVSDGDAVSAGETLTVTLTDAAGRLSATGAGVSGSGTQALTVTGSVAAVNAALATLTIQEPSAGSDTVQVAVNDGRGGTDSRTVAVTTAAANVPPVLTVPGAQTETAGTAAPLAGITVADSDAGSAGETITVSLTDAAGTLTASGAGGAAVGGSGSTALTLTGSLAQVNAALGTLAILEAAAGSDTVTAAVSDGRGGTDSRTVAVGTVAANAPPVLTVPGAQAETAGVQAAVAGVSVADPDAGSAGETITLAVTDTSGLLSASNAGGAVVGGSGTASLTLTGTLAQVNAAAGTLAILEGAAGGDTIGLAVNDGRGGSDSRSITVTTVAAPNLPPVTTVPGAQAETAGVAAALAGLGVSDGDAGSAGETITVGLTDTAGLLSASAAGGAAVGGVGTASLTLSGSLAQVNAALATLTILEASAGSDTVTVATSDGRGGSDSHAIAITTTRPAGQGFTLTRGGDTVAGGAGDDTVTAAAGTLSAGDRVDGGGGTNELVLAGAGAFDLRAPAALLNIQAITAAEGQAAYAAGGAVFAAQNQVVLLRDGLDATVNVAPGTLNPANPKPGTITIVGAHNAAVINLGPGNDSVVVGDARETVHGGSGSSVIQVTAATIGATIDGGTGSASLVVGGGGTAVMGANITRVPAVFLSSAAPAYDFTANGIAGLVVTDLSRGADTLRAGGLGQTLTGGAGRVTMVGFAGGGTTFSNSASVFDGDTLSGLVQGDAINVTDMAFASLTRSFTEDAGGTFGVLTLTDGAHRTALTVTGSLGLQDFAFSAMGAGTHITLQART